MRRNNVGIWKIPNTLFLILFFCSAVRASSNNAGTNAGAFLKIPVDARGTALGPAMAAMAEGTEALSWNPAALANTENQEFSASDVIYYQNVNISHAAYAYPFDESALAGSLFYLSPGSLDGRDIQGNQTGDFQFYDLVGSIGYGRRIRSRAEGTEIDVGAELKLVQEVIAENSYNNPAIDVGILAIPIDDLQFGLTLQNLSSSKADFPKEVTGAASYTLFKVFTPGVAVKYADDAPARFSVGGEYKFPDVGGVLRAGYQSHDALDDSTDSQISAFRNASIAGLTMGAGLTYHPPIFKTTEFQIDYAMAPFGALGISHTVTVKVKW